MWDAPEPRDRNFNRFARREVTKAARAAEYWADDVDEYALPGMPGVDPNRAPGSGFVSARDRMKQPGSAEPRSPKPPPVILKSRNHQFPEPLPFTFNAPAEAKRPGADLGMFTSSSSSSLAMMKGLGLPGSTGSNGSSPLASPNPDRSPKPPEIASFQSAANSSLSALKGLGLPDLPTGGLPTGGTGQGQGVQLAKGTKRLGMGRPAPWGTKRQRAE
jgi:DNA helicase-2/ATP-dependent DNA helicase PcrA